MTIDEMQAGRELDALVAKLMGWTFSEWATSPSMLMPPKGSAGEKEGRLYEVPHYSTDIAAAWQVVEKLRLEHLCCLTLKADYHYVWDIEWVIAPKTWDEDVPHTKHSLGYAIESLPLGICRAALKVVE